MKEHIIAMIHGPGTFRAFLQPSIAVVLGILHGLRDRRAGRRPYLAALFGRGGDHLRHLADGVRAMLVPLCIAVLASLIAQQIVRSHLYFGYALIYAAIFVALPYFLARSVTNRLATRASTP